MHDIEQGNMSNVSQPPNRKTVTRSSVAMVDEPISAGVLGNALRSDRSTMINPLAR